MKKTIFAIITVIVICVLGITLSGCNRSTPTQKLLTNSRAWTSENTDETLIYDAAYKSGSEDFVAGTLTVHVKGYNNETASVGDWSKENAIGYVVTTDLAMDNGDVKTSSAYFSTSIQVLYSECVQTINGETSGYKAEYRDEKCYYTTFEGEGENKKESSGEIKVGDFFDSPYIDNAILYQVARCLPAEVSSFTFNIPDFTTGKAQSVSVTAARSTTMALKDANGTDFVCYPVSITLNRTFPGSGEALTCAISQSPYPSETDPEINNLIVQISEGETLYTLKSATTAE